GERAARSRTTMMIVTRKAWLIAVLGGGIGSSVALLIDLHALLLSYLATAVAVSAIPIGALVVLMVTYLVRGNWTEGLHAPLDAVTGSFAAIDWIESLTPEFHSSIYGLMFLTFQLLSGFAFALLIALRQSHSTFRYGDILLSVLLLWAYIHAMQYIVIWSGDIPEEVIWYIRRSSGGWGVVLWGLVLLQFLVPFFALLMERVRSGRGALLIIA